MSDEMPIRLADRQPTDDERLWEAIESAYWEFDAQRKLIEIDAA